MNIYKLLASR